MSTTRGPIPKPDARRRNKPAIPTDSFDVDGFDGPIPDPVTALSDAERELYDWAWRTPAACGWHWSDAEQVADWARLKVLVRRYLAGEIVKSAGDSVVAAELPSSLLSQVTNREDRLYLSPMARKRARTAIVEGAKSSKAGKDGNVVTPDRWTA